MSTESNRLERVTQDVLDGSVALFAGWTAGYQIGFLLGLPAGACVVLGGLAAVAALLLLLRWRHREPELPRGATPCPLWRSSWPYASR